SEPMKPCPRWSCTAARNAASLKAIFLLLPERSFWSNLLQFARHSRAIFVTDRLDNNVLLYGLGSTHDGNVLLEFQCDLPGLGGDEENVFFDCSWYILLLQVLEKSFALLQRNIILCELPYVDALPVAVQLRNQVRD